LGPFHAQTFESVAVHTPGVDVFMPSTAVDAAGMLNAAFASQRPTLFFYPKSALNDPENTTSDDIDRQLVPIGKARVVRTGRAITLVGWGNTVSMCEQVATTLETVGIDAEVIDLRSLSPWDKETVTTSAEKTGYLIAVHEDNHTCGLGGEVLATVAERARVPVAMRRVTRSDTFVPCNFANQMEVLPSFERVLAAAAEMLDLDLSWTKNETVEEGVAYIEAVGSGPADETVIVTELFVQPGQQIKRGDVVASLEATKSVFDLTAGEAGTIDETLVAEGDTVNVGAPMFKLSTAGADKRVRRIAYSGPGTPKLRLRNSECGVRNQPFKFRTPHSEFRTPAQVGLVDVTTVSGSREVANRQLVGDGDGLTDEQVVNRTGIASRRWIAEGESAVGMAVDACRALLDRQRLTLTDIDLLLCHTTTPTGVTPSTACQVLSGIAAGSEALVQAYDINAACSGYLYAMQAGYDYLQSRPEARVLVVTAEALSTLLDTNDQDTAFLFGDASSATLLVGEAHIDTAQVRIHQSDLSAKSDDTDALCVPLAGEGYIQMNGRKVFSEAVRSMLSSLNRACRGQGLSLGELDLIVPHQANERITESIRRRVGVEVYSNIQYHGNTSSSSIPLCLAELLPQTSAGKKIGLCAFGGGFTFGATILETLRDGTAVAPRPQDVRRAS
jgi:2-oxoisovalerate dehydrogenase E1 component